MTPTDIRAARTAAHLTQTQAGQTIGGTLRTWQDWESGARTMPSAAWDLFLLCTDQHPTHRLVERAPAEPPVGRATPVDVG